MILLIVYYTICLFDDFTFGIFHPIIDKQLEAL